MRARPNLLILMADQQTRQWYRYYKSEYDFGGDFHL
jgi:hypothetical protein